MPKNYKSNLFYLVIFSLFHYSIFSQKFSRDTIPFILNQQNTIYVQAIFNETDTLNLNFDTGTTELILTHNTLKNKLKIPVKKYDTYYNLKIGTQNYATKVYDAKLSGHDTDGRFGWDLFSKKTVELNYDHNLMIVHSKIPDHVTNDSSFVKLKIKKLDNVFMINATINQDGKELTDYFLFDTGYQRTVMLDCSILEKENFPIEKMPVVKRVIMKGAQGNEIPVITSILELLKIGTHDLKKVPIQQLTINKPIQKHTIHYLGNEVLKRFNCYLDFQNDCVYLKPNSLFFNNYIDQK